MRALVLGVAVAAIFAAPAAAVRPAVLRGHVTLQAPEPLCGKRTCVTPSRSLVVSFRSAHARLTVRTDANGDFRLLLPPGRYTVSTAATADSPEATLTPALVVVKAGAAVTLRFVYRPGTP